jgi:predicted MFS family arabinose efflux permease
VLRPLIAKGAWNGTGVAALLLSGQVLEQRYGFSASGVGLTVATFGIGLGIGNLSAGWLRKLCGREEISLVVVTLLVVTALSSFMLLPLPLIGSLACLTCWGAALGAGAPSSTVILAARAGADKGMVLAFAETFNNVAILCTVPLATARLMAGGPRSAFAILSFGLALGLGLTLIDVVLSRKSGG